MGTEAITPRKPLSLQFQILSYAGLLTSTQVSRESSAGRPPDKNAAS